MKKQTKRPWGVLIAIVLGIVIGTCTYQGYSLWGFNLKSLLPFYELGGKLFINALTLVVVPLVSASIITGVARIGNDQQFGRLGVKIFGFYLGTSLLAILIGLLFFNILQPGKGLHAEFMTQATSHLITEEPLSIFNLFLSIIPSNIVDAWGKGQMLGIIFFSLIFGYCVSKINTRGSEIIRGFWQGLFDVMIQITHLIMKILPIGVCFLVIKVFAESGLPSLSSLGLFSLTVLAGLAGFMFVGLPLLLKYIAKVDPKRHFRAMGPALITAFSTSSSSATLPVTLDCVEKRAKVSNRISSLVIPLGTSINTAGSALYECVAVLFVIQVYGQDLSFGTQCSTVFLSLIMSMGVAGIPSGSLVAIIVILKTMGLPIEGIGLFIAVDRILDMCRTTANVLSDSCCAVLVAKSEGEKGVLSSDP